MPKGINRADIRKIMSGDFTPLYENGQHFHELAVAAHPRHSISAYFPNLRERTENLYSRLNTFARKPINSTNTTGPELTPLSETLDDRISLQPMNHETINEKTTESAPNSLSTYQRMKDVAITAYEVLSDYLFGPLE